MRSLRTLGLVLGALLAALLLPVAAAAPVQETGDPAYSVDLIQLDAALDCDQFTHPDTEPVLLIHGTFTAGHEQFDWNYAPLLRDSGRDVCVVTYPDRGFGDMQTSAEYVARAVQRIHAESGRMVDMVGHSQGALMPRWALKYWPSVRAAVDDFVLLAGPNHGTTAAGDHTVATGEQPAVFHQFRVGSDFVAAVNDGDETPGEVSYTSIFTDLDEVVQPIDPPTAALDADSADDDPRVTNIRIQDLCPSRAVDHLSIGTTDALTMRLVLDALGGEGPADPSRIGIDADLCSVPDQYVTPDTFLQLLAQVPESIEQGLPEFHLTATEPPLRSYAAASSPAHRDDEPAAVPDDGDPGDVDPDDVANGDDTAAPEGEAVAADSGSRQIARTGQAIPILAAGVAIAVALLLRIGSSRLRDDDHDDDED